MIHYEHGEIATITLDNPQRHNALSHDDFRELAGILADVEQSRPRVLILTGRGNSFCAGVEFSSLRSGDWVYANPLNALCERVMNLEMPVIAALNGHFVGGGAELAFACDLRIAPLSAQCKIPAAAISVHYEPSGIDRIVRVVGEQIARRLFLTLETFTGEALLDHGFIDFASDTPLETAKTMSARIAKLAPFALSGMKASLNGNNTDARDRIAKCFASEDFAEAMQAVSEKRKPVFRGA